jgi:hypothetical protein
MPVYQSKPIGIEKIGNTILRTTIPANFKVFLKYTSTHCSCPANPLVTHVKPTFQLVVLRSDNFITKLRSSFFVTSKSKLAGTRSRPSSLFLRRQALPTCTLHMLQTEIKLDK